MDKNQLSALLKELLTVNDRVSLPGMGSFISEVSSAYFTDEGKTINPPFKKIYFRSAEKWNDTLLETLYAERMGITMDQSRAAIEKFVIGFMTELNKSKSIELQGLGIMRATNENNYFFVADDDLDIYSEAAGLEPISIKKLIDVDTPESEYDNEDSDYEIEQSEEQFGSDQVNKAQSDIEKSDDQDNEREDDGDRDENPDGDQDDKQSNDNQIVLDQQELIVDINEDFFDKSEIEASEVEIEESENNAVSAESRDIESDKKDNEKVTQERENNVGKAYDLKRVWITLLIVLIALILIIFIFAVFFEQQFDQLLNKLLYSAEELDLINSRR